MKRSDPHSNGAQNGASRGPVRAPRAARQRNGYLDAEFEITLSHNSRRINVAVCLDNQANDHRVRVLIPTPFTAQEVLADTQFGTVTRAALVVSY